MVEFGADYFEKQIVGDRKRRNRKLRGLVIVDHFNSGLARLDNHYKMTASATIASFRKLRAMVPQDQRIKVHLDHGPGFDNEEVEGYCEGANIELAFSPKGMPWYNPFAERCVRTVKEEALNLEFIAGVKHAQPLFDGVREMFNQRENMRLGYKTPAQLWQEASFRPAPAQVQQSPLGAAA